jgi:hypothetical protein
MDLINADGVCALLGTTKMKPIDGGTTGTNDKVQMPRTLCSETKMCPLAFAEVRLFQQARCDVALWHVAANCATMLNRRGDLELIDSVCPCGYQALRRCGQPPSSSIGSWSRVKRGVQYKLMQKLLGEKEHCD